MPPSSLLRSADIRKGRGGDDDVRRMLYHVVDRDIVPVRIVRSRRIPPRRLDCHETRPRGELPARVRERQESSLAIHIRLLIQQKSLIL